MRQPWREPVASIVAHRALFSCGAKGIGDALRCPLVIGRKGDADMAVVEDGVVLAIGLLDLIEALRDQEGAHDLASEKGAARLDEIQSAQRWKLVMHHEQLFPGRGIGTVLGMQMFGQQAADLFGYITDRKRVGTGKRRTTLLD